MRRTLTWAAVILTALLLQSTLFAQIKLAGAKPELLYLVAIVMGMLEGPSVGSIGGFWAGMGQDFLLNQPKGITALTLTLVGYVMGRIRPFISSPSPWIPVITVAIATAGGIIFYGIVSFLLGQLEAGFGFLLRTAVLSALYNALLTPLVYPVLRRVGEAARTKNIYRW